VGCMSRSPATIPLLMQEFVEALSG